MMARFTLETDGADHRLGRIYPKVDCLIIRLWINTEEQTDHWSQDVGLALFRLDALTTKLELFLARPLSNSSIMLVNSHTGLPPASWDF